jgi:putative endonuclease
MGIVHERGRRGEVLAARHLERCGWNILDRNWRAGHSELDLVAERGAVLAFVEVKSRSAEGSGGPLDAVTPRKRRELARAATAWLLARGDRMTRYETVRFDVVAVHLSRGGGGEVVHLPDAWRIGDP